MSTELNQRIEEMTAGLKSLASELKDKQNQSLDRIAAIEAEIESRDKALEGLLAEKRRTDAEERIKALEARFGDELKPGSKAAQILAGATVLGESTPGSKAMHGWTEDNFLSAMVAARKGDPDAHHFLKAVLGTSNATGLSIVPNNFVSSVVEWASAGNIYRQLMNVVTGVQGAGVDIPYERDEIIAALKQGAYGSNKDVRDFGFGEATATLYTIATIADIGNQLLRQSNGAAEQVARRRIGKGLARAEAEYITNGSGSSQPKGLFQSLTDNYTARYITALSSEPRAAALGKGISALESRSHTTDGLAIVMNPTDFWEGSVEGLGTSYAGGWAINPSDGPTAVRTSLWGVPVYRDPFWPSAQAGTALIANFGAMDLFFGEGIRVDVSSEAGDRFDKNITGFRGEEEMAFNADPYVLTGHVQRVTGL